MSRLDALFNRYARDLLDEVPERFLPLVVDDRKVGFVEEAVARTLFLRCGAFYLEKKGLFVKPSVAPKEFKGIFAQAYGVLLQAGLAFRHDELLDVVPDVYDKPFAVAPRGVFRALGLITTSVHVFATQAGRCVLTERSRAARVMPGAFDCLASGLVGAAEQPRIAAVREAYEEAGVVPGSFELVPAVKFFSQRTVPEGLLRERVLGFDAVLNENAAPRCRDGSVEAFHAMDFAELEAALAERPFMPEAALCCVDALARTNGVDAGGGFFRHPLAATTWDAPARLA